jgi:hypothetical protein
MHNNPQLPRNPDLLLAATLFLMTQYALQRRSAIAQAVADHFERLMDCAADLPPRLVLALPRLHQQWLAHFASPHGTSPTVNRAPCVVVPFRAVERRR